MFLVKLSKALKSHKVKYALVGGYAVSLHGAVRGTLDIDIVVPFKLKQFIAAQNALESIGLESRLPIEASDVFHFRNEYIEKRNLIAWSFLNKSNPAELVDIIITEDRDSLECVKIKVQGHTLEVIALDDLIKIKNKSQREQDIADVEALKKIREMK